MSSDLGLGGFVSVSDGTLRWLPLVLAGIAMIVAPERIIKAIGNEPSRLGPKIVCAAALCF